MSCGTFLLHRNQAINWGAGEPFDARRNARWLLRTTRRMVLATLDRASGFPYSTVTNVSMEPDGTIVFYASQLSHHAQNILIDGRISVTLTRDGVFDALRDQRLTLIGQATTLSGVDFKRAHARYKRKFFRSARYLELGDALLFKLDVIDLFFNGGPARYSDDLRPEDLVTSLLGAEDLVYNEVRLIKMLNRQPTRLRCLASAGGGVRGRWYVTTVDPEGIDLASEANFHRVVFGDRLTTQEEVLAFIR